MNMDLYDDCIEHVDKCLRDAKMEKSDIHDVVLVGGSTRIPKIQHMLQELFKGKELCKRLNADEAVAYGAAFHAASLARVGSNKNSVLVDVAPLSLGICLHCNRMRVIIPRNTTIPTRMSMVMRTAYNNQNWIKFPVYEGERPMAKDNKFLGIIYLYNIPLAPKGVLEFDVYFNIDADGILTVSAELRGTNNKGQITITNHSGRLSKDEIDRMVREAKRFKVQDQEQEKAARSKNTLENYIHKMTGTLKDWKQVGNKEQEEVA